MCADALCFQRHYINDEGRGQDHAVTQIPGWWERLFITKEQWEEKIEKTAIQARAYGYITAINECTVEQDIPDVSFANKHYKWIKGDVTSNLVESLKMYMYQHGMTTRTIRDHVAWKDAHT